MERSKVARFGEGEGDFFFFAQGTGVVPQVLPEQQAFWANGQLDAHTVVVTFLKERLPGFSRKESRGDCQVAGAAILAIEVAAKGVLGGEILRRIGLDTPTS